MQIGECFLIMLYVGVKCRRLSSRFLSFNFNLKINFLYIEYVFCFGIFLHSVADLFNIAKDPDPIRSNEDLALCYQFTDLDPASY